MPSTNARILAIGAAIASLVASTACLQPSLNPLLMPADSTFDARLLGSWACGPQNLTFVRQTDPEIFRDHDFFSVTVAGEESIDNLSAWVGPLGNAQFINFYPDSTSRKTTAFYGAHTVAAHTFGRIRIEPGRLRLDLLNDEWVGKKTKAGGRALGRVYWPDERILLTATTSELQQFAREHAEDFDAFSERLDCRRE